MFPKLQGSDAMAPIGFVAGLGRGYFDPFPTSFVVVALHRSSIAIDFGMLDGSYEAGRARNRLRYGLKSVHKYGSTITRTNSAMGFRIWSWFGLAAFDRTGL
jgi:hypothetical protein